jgi:hypothetical protein
VTWEPWLAVVFLLAGLACLLLLVAFRGARRAATALRPATLSAATARALYGAMTPLHRLEATEPDAVPVTLGARVRIADAAGRLYDALPDTISVRYAHRLVPVPLKTILGRQECVNALTAGFWGPTAGLEAVEAVCTEAFRVAARRGLTEERLVGYGTPLDGAATGQPAAPS